MYTIDFNGICSFEGVTRGRCVTVFTISISPDDVQSVSLMLSRSSKFGSIELREKSTVIIGPKNDLSPS